MIWDRLAHINKVRGMINSDRYHCRVQHGYIEERRGAVLVSRRSGKLMINCPRCMWTKVYMLEHLDWNGNGAAPTIHGPVNCPLKPFGCGWYGRLTDGWFIREHASRQRILI